MKILIVDDEESVIFALTELLTNEGYEISSAPSAELALSRLENEKFEISLVDYNLPGINGIDLLTVIRKNYSWMEVIIITAFGSEKIAIDAVKKGAYDYISKPFSNVMITNRVNHIRDIIFSKHDKSADEFGSYFSPVMNNIMEKIKTVAHSDIPVLITGESGTGKELIAKSCHHHSGRKGKFISINCSALPENLIESELFGAEKGAFTGSISQKIGLFERADNGTIFLDEIGDMAYELQAKLLRVIQENELRRIGSNDNIRINARVVAATNIDIEDRVKKNTFREDLFYRLNVVRIRIPSLKNRKEEIRPLSLVFLNDFNMKYHKEIKGFDDDAMIEIENYPWPGNIRELKNKIEHAVVICNSGWITSDYLSIDDIETEDNHDDDGDIINPEEYKNLKIEKNSGYGFSDFSSLPISFIEAKKIVSDEFDKKFILHHLNKYNWNVKMTAEKIGLSRQDLYKKMKKVGIKKNIEYT
jgi:DNA-binding NtrC family response regulator